MSRIAIVEMAASEVGEYQAFLNEGLIRDEESFRITPADDASSGFPTEGRSDSFTLAARVDGALAAVVSFEREGKSREKLRHKGLLFRMYVHGDFRGQGIGRKLIEAVVARASNLAGIEQINLTVIADNLGAKRLYEKLGFEAFATEYNAIKWKGKYFAENQMALRLKRHE